MTRSGFWMAGAALVTLAACDGSGTGPEGGARVSLSLAAAPRLVASSSVAGTSTAGGFSAALAPITDGSGRALDITTVQLVLREVELKRESDDDCEDDSCEEFEAGPVLVTLPLGGGVITPFTEAITPGTYDELELEVHEPEDDGGDRARFFAQHPDWPRQATVRVAGTFDPGTGPQPFDVFLKVVTKLERDLDPALVVDGATDPSTVNLTLEVDVSSWFLNSSGGLIDPRAIATSPSLLAAVTQNVRESFRALRDDDRDGDDDHGGRGRGGGGDDHGGNSGRGGGDD